MQTIFDVHLFECYTSCDICEVTILTTQTPALSIPETGGLLGSDDRTDGLHLVIAFEKNTVSNEYGLVDMFESGTYTQTHSVVVDEEVISAAGFTDDYTIAVGEYDVEEHDSYWYVNLLIS